MTTVSDLFARALGAHRTGRPEAAIPAYRAVLAADPQHSTARHLLGFALLQIGATADAEPLLSRAARDASGRAEVWMHLGLARIALNRTQPAESALRRSIVLAPGLAEAVERLLGLAVDRARSSAPSPLPAIRAAAERAAKHAVALSPLRSPGWHGLALADAGRGAGGPIPASAERNLRRAIVTAPGDGPATTDLADVLRQRRMPEPAVRVSRFAACLLPRSSAVRVILSAALYDLDRISGAVWAARSAALLSPDTANAYGNLAQCLYREAAFGPAIREGRRARILAPSDAQVLANQATYHLAAGDLAEGWRLFRHRPSRRAIDRSANRPAHSWSGERGARLLVLAEQGLGDELLFASCWPDLSTAVNEGRLDAVRVEIDPRLRPLAERSFPNLDWLDRDRTAGPTDGARRSADFGATHWAAAGDLPSVFRNQPADFPARPVHLATDPARVAAFRRWLEAVAPGRRRVGLCWRSGLRTADRAKHYPDLADCDPLLWVQDTAIVVLQYDDCSAEIADAERREGAVLMVPPGLDRHDDLDGVAALIVALDWVVSADTAVLALAGAVGAPTVGFGLGPGWVMLGQDRTPWHPSVTRLGRKVDESWAHVMQRIADDEARRHGVHADSE